jgi:hypothetical protein
LRTQLEAFRAEQTAAARAMELPIPRLGAGVVGL